MKADRKRLIMELLEDYKNGKIEAELGMMILNQIMTSRELTKKHFKDIRTWVISSFRDLKEKPLD
jgi:hypothetical protein